MRNALRSFGLSTVRCFGAAQPLPVARVIGAPAGGIAADWRIFRAATSPLGVIAVHSARRRMRPPAATDVPMSAFGSSAGFSSRRPMPMRKVQRGRRNRRVAFALRVCVGMGWHEERAPARTARAHGYGVSSEWFGEALLIVLCRWR